MSISVPPGRAGLAPSLRLGYNLFSGNGIAGIGWSLEFMSVKRQTDKGFPLYDSGDTFVLGGEELVPLNNAEHDWRCKNERASSDYGKLIHPRSPQVLTGMQKAISYQSKPGIARLRTSARPLRHRRGDENLRPSIHAGGQSFTSRDRCSEFL